MSTLPLEHPDATDTLAPFWQGSADELQWLEEALREELSPSDAAPATSGPWVNPLVGLADEAASEEGFLTIFVDDTLLTLDDLTAMLLAHEGSGTREEIEKLVAIFHRIKGSAGMVGLKRASKLAHVTEDSLQHLLTTGGVLNSALTDAMLRGSDALREYVVNLRQGIGAADRLAEAAEGLRGACAEPASESPATVPPAAGAVSQPSVPVPAATDSAAEPAPAAPSTAPVPPSRAGEAMRVEIDHLDRLMGLAGQLTIHNARFHSIMEQFRDDPTDRFRALFEAVEQLDRISDGLRRSVMQVRMVPIGPLLNRYQRVVRDLTRASGKLARLELRGEKTELDKRMIDELGDPLLHIIRNALDHGIEHPDVRLAAGKAPEGTLSIHAVHRGNGILIQVRDDGAGLNLERLRQKSVAKGVVSAAEAAAMTPAQLIDLIWRPGMSTAESVTEISGRGVGMDIVRTRIDSLHGKVDVESIPGEGTTFTIRLPLTLAILNCLMIEFRGEVFAIPMELVEEIVRLDEQSPAQSQGHAMVRIRERVLATMRLDDVFSWKGIRHQGIRHTPCPACIGTRSVPDTLVVVGDRGHDVGLAVDRVLGQEDVVIKSLADNFRDVPGISGATILGDGRVALILDIPALLNMSLARKAEACAEPARA